ncbi:MAG: hypothetical protein HYZ26_06055 [Chloroflexi bacterium]|nr:hypothetical protein [Chloroflexota bacterium]
MARRAVICPFGFGGRRGGGGCGRVFFHHGPRRLFRLSGRRLFCFGWLGLFCCRRFFFLLGGRRLFLFFFGGLFGQFSRGLFSLFGGSLFRFGGSGLGLFLLAHAAGASQAAAVQWAAGGQNHADDDKKIENAQGSLTNLA